MFKKLASFLLKPISWFSRFPGKIRTVLLILITVAVGIAVRAILFRPAGGYVFATVQTRSVTETVSESGIVTLANKAGVYSPAAGVIEEIYVKNGREVLSQDRLFSVVSTASVQEKAAALAAYRAAVSALRQAENNRRDTQATVDRVHDDLKNKDQTETFTERETRTTAEVAHDNAYDALLSARAAHDSALLAYRATQDTLVTAPVAGVVSNLSVATGSAVQAYSVLAPPSPVLIISRPGPAEISLMVGESDINKISVGQTADITLDAVPDRAYSGTVIRVDDFGTLVSGVIKYSVYIQLNNPDFRIRPGMTADVDLVTRQLDGVLTVPNSAVKPYQKGRAVRVLTAGIVEYVPVITGIRGKEYTQIVSGLDSGREIIVSLTNDKAPRSSPFGF